MTTVTNARTHSPFKRSLIAFTAVYVIITLAIIAFQMMTDGSHNSGLSIASLLVSGILAHNVYTTTAGRSPAGRDILKLAAYSTVIAVLVSLMPLAIILTMAGLTLNDLLNAIGMTGDNASNLFFMFLPIVMLLYFFVLWLAYGSVGRWIVSKIQVS
ncbi:MAG: ABZJ_00895 family protein [Alphaproteobacteria bacterium]|nr:ABZJ_00895 family protein [Alphaproteobacteria bacterium]